MATPYIIILMILCGFVFGISLISIAKILKKNKDIFLDKKPLNRANTLTFLGGLILTTSLFFSFSYSVYALMWHSTLHSISEATCREISITEQYKMIIADQHSGTRDVSLEDIGGETVIVWIDEYAVLGNYFLGKYAGDYFWVDLQTGGFRHINNDANFKESINLLGISEVPKFSSAYSICDERQCQPCTTHTPSP